MSAQKNNKLANYASLAGFFGIGATTRTSQEMLCPVYARFFLLNGTDIAKNLFFKE